MRDHLPRLLLAALAALLAACGSSGGTTSAPGGTTTAGGTTTTAGTAGAAKTACDGVSFGSALAPQDQPAEIHRYAAPPALQIDPGKLYQATISTTKGTIVLCLQPSLAPKTVNNFVVLARNHFYDGLTFHRVVPQFVIQGGDPQGSGGGGPGYQFADEPVKGQYTVGCLAMANAGPNTNGSQFFICIADDTAQLRPLYNLFGYVSSGVDVALRIQQGDVMRTVTVAAQQ
ncbi:MAG: peptidylprolyl isomerase [Chloroflexi bacterium]|nr:MAG: peptidylprolyl isomerase [Chloroflexota bacterium]